MQAYADAASLVDDKWDAAFGQADLVRQHLGRLLNVAPEKLVLGASTHDLLIRFLSALPIGEKRVLLTTSGEFHSMRRQLRRLGESGFTIQVIPVDPLESLAERMIQELNSQTLAVMMSAVFFQDGRVFEEVAGVVRAATEQSIASLVDCYHAINVLPFDAQQDGLSSAFLLGGGYKYLQAGEGNCFMALPDHHHPGWNSRPIVTGWFAEFGLLDQATHNVPYGPDHQAFAGSTYDPVSHYRANRVFQFFVEQQLTPARLADINRQQQAWLLQGLRELKLSPQILDLFSLPSTQRGGFLALPSPCAERWVQLLRTKKVYCDSRNGYLRLGPAPYVSQLQIQKAIEIIGQVAKELSGDRRI